MTETTKTHISLRDATDCYWPGSLPWRTSHSRRGYASYEDAARRARVVMAHYAAHYGAACGPDLRVVVD